MWNPVLFGILMLGVSLVLCGVVTHRLEVSKKKRVAKERKVYKETNQKAQ
ncbi:hypothetical protein ACTFR8_23445 [Bacillus cereus group sp. MYBK15-3]|nr:hypothetical protein [Bacillus cereus]MBX9158554.1 hypothetical protein [Bacillus cereus]